MSYKKEPKWPYFIPLFVAIFMSLIYIIYVQFWVNIGVSSQGVVQSMSEVQITSHQQYSSTTKTMYHYKIRYSDQSHKEHVGTYRSNNDNLAIGDNVKILYIPNRFDNLELFKLKIHPGPILAFFFSGALIFLWLLRERARLLKKEKPS